MTVDSGKDTIMYESADRFGRAVTAPDHSDQPTPSGQCAAAAVAPAAVPPAPPSRNLGVLAFGDSITNGGGELQWGVALQSWALWVARSLGLPYTGYAVDGARAADVKGAQIPAFERLSARPDGRYDVGCLYIGVNDVRACDWDAAAFAADHLKALRFLVARCDRVIAVAAPRALGVPPTPSERVDRMNRAVEAHAGEVAALLLDLTDFGARNHVMADRVHPTAFGQIAIAKRALAVLARDGLPAKVDPATLISYETTWPARLRGDLTYAYRSAKAWLRAR
jgi:lysophospholipase L1-like esterase